VHYKKYIITLKKYILKADILFALLVQHENMEPHTQGIMAAQS
jgi:hypothetical protein